MEELVSEEPSDAHEDEASHRWDRKQLESIETNRRTFWHRSLMFLLFVHNYDLHAIYKPAAPLGLQRGDTHRQLARRPPSAARRHCSASGSARLSLPVTQADRKRHRCTGLLRAFVLYCLVKSWIISIGQHSLLGHHYAAPDGRHRQPLLSLAQIKLIGDYLGNPLSELKEVALLMYSAPAGLCAICFILMPIYYARHPLDIPMIRFILKPVHELKRIDQNIAHKMDNIRQSLLVYERQKRLLLLSGPSKVVFAPECAPLDEGGRRAPLSGPQKAWLLQVEQDYCSRLTGYLAEFERRPLTFRPEQFSFAYFRYSSANMGGLVAAVYVTYAVGFIVLTTFCVIRPLMERCELRRGAAVGLCNPFDIYTPPEMLVLVELPLMLLLCCFISSLNLVLFSLVTSSRIDLIKSIKSQMLRCQSSIVRHDNELVRAHERLGRRPFPFARMPEARMGLDKFLLESLIRLLVSESELRSSSRCISELTILPFYYAIGIIFFAIINWQLNIPGSNKIRYFIIVATWLNFNAVTIACAYSFSRIVEFERILWLVLAANASFQMGHSPSLALVEEAKAEAEAKVEAKVEAKAEEARPAVREQERGRPARRTEVRCASFVADLWTKFALATSLNIDSYCARPLNVRLTYKGIIELNFFFIFLYSLAKGLNRA